MPATAFSLERGEDGPRYDGPHGPVTLPAAQEPDATRVLTPDGEARLAWGMGSRDRSALERGVPARIGGRELVLRKVGRTLELGDGAGAALVVARPRSRGRVVLERPDGAAVASFKPSALAGEVEEAATADEVALLVLLIGSNAASALERRVPLPFSPFGLIA